MVNTFFLTVLFCYGCFARQSSRDSSSSDSRSSSNYGEYELYDLFMLVVDNSCILNDDECIVQKEIIAELVSNINNLNVNNKVGYVSYGEDDSDTKLEISLSNDEYQNDINEYIQWILEDYECFKQDNYKLTDLWEGINIAIKDLDSYLFENRFVFEQQTKSKIILINNCQNTNNICSTSSSRSSSSNRHLLKAGGGGGGGSSSSRSSESSRSSSSRSSSGSVSGSVNIDECNEYLICEELEYNDYKFISINIAFNNNEFGNNYVNDNYLSCLNQNQCFGYLESDDYDAMYEEYYNIMLNCMPCITSGYPTNAPSDIPDTTTTIPSPVSTTQVSSTQVSSTQSSSTQSSTQSSSAQSSSTKASSTQASYTQVSSTQVSATTVTTAIRTSTETATTGTTDASTETMTETEETFPMFMTSSTTGE